MALTLVGLSAAPAALAASPAQSLTNPPTIMLAQAQTTTSDSTAPFRGAPAAASKGTTQVVANPYGPSQLWTNGDFVARATIIILSIMSLGTWYILVAKLVDQQRLIMQAKAADRTFWNKRSLKDGIETLDQSSAFRFIAETGLKAGAQRDGMLTEQIDLPSWITMSIQRAVDAVNARLQGGIAFLATVGSTAPFVGLFGTVWGIYHALVAIGIAGQASIDKVAGPVGEALIMTAFGLFVAVPAVLGYNWLIRRNKSVLESIRTFGSNLDAVLLSNAGHAAVPVPTAASTRLQPAMQGA
jgi:biopolymer transport protein ExbB